MRIDRKTALPRRWLQWALLLAVIAVAASGYPSPCDYYTRPRALEVEASVGVRSGLVAAARLAAPSRFKFVDALRRIA